MSNRLASPSEPDTENDLNLFYTNETTCNDRRERGKQKKVNQIHEMLDVIRKQIENPAVIKFRLDHIQHALKNIISANSGCTALEQADLTSFLKSEKVHPNANNVLQPRFKATQKPPGKKKQHRLKAPTEEEKKQLLSTPDQSQTTEVPSASNPLTNPHLRAPPSMLNKPFEIKLPNGKKMKVIYTNKQ